MRCEVTMDVSYCKRLQPLIEALAGEMDLYVPYRKDEHYLFGTYDPAVDVTFNAVRTCTPPKEFLFPPLERAAVYPEKGTPPSPDPFAVFGMKECDLASLEVLDAVFGEDEFRDPLYMNWREKMFIVSGDCTDILESCFCTLFEGRGFPREGFDLNCSPAGDGFIVEAGSEKGAAFMSRHGDIFSAAPAEAIAARDARREEIRKRLEEQNAAYVPAGELKELIEQGIESEVFDREAGDCVECQACTRVCPTCHCFFLFDSGEGDYFEKMKMWDSCIRQKYAAVAGGANPREVLGDRIRHRFLHKYVYFLERYGIRMCVGCGRCIDACMGDGDMREVLKKLKEEPEKKSAAT